MNRLVSGVFVSCAILFLPATILAQSSRLSEGELSQIRKNAIAMADPANPMVVEMDGKITLDSIKKKIYQEKEKMPAVFFEKIIDSSKTQKGVMEFGCEISKVLPSGVEKKTGGLSGALIMASCGNDFVMIRQEPGSIGDKIQTTLHPDSLNHHILGNPSSNRYSKTTRGLELTEMSWIGQGWFYNIRYFSDDKNLEKRVRSANKAVMLAERVAISNQQ